MILLAIPYAGYGGLTLYAQKQLKKVSAVLVCSATPLAFYALFNYKFYGTPLGLHVLYNQPASICL